MLKTLKMAGLAAAVSIGGIMPIATPAMAQSSTLEFFIGPDGVRVRASDFCERNPGYDRCREYNRGGYGRDSGRRNFRSDERRSERRCDPDEAVEKARRMGVRRARVVDVDRRTIDVAGSRRGERVIITFGRRGNCPIVGY